jgi:RNA-directed DNA polymerase
VRYADDFIITGISKELLEEKVKPLVEAFMATRGLQLSPEKTVITHISEGFDFLGQNVRKYHGKMLIKPSKKNLRAHLQKIRGIVRGNLMARQDVLIHQLNPVIRGWANYHRHVVAKETYSYVDYRVWKLLWRWCCRRHKNRYKRWVKDKYFHTVGSERWVFQGVAIKASTSGLTFSSSNSFEIPVMIKSSA